MLPIEWREENVRVRQMLASFEYPTLSATERKPRLLADLWPQLWVLIFRLADIFSRVPKRDERKSEFQKSFSFLNYNNLISISRNLFTPRMSTRFFNH